MYQIEQDGNGLVDQRATNKGNELLPKMTLLDLEWSVVTSCHSQRLGSKPHWALGHKLFSGQYGFQMTSSNGSITTQVLILFVSAPHLLLTLTNCIRVSP